jgi:ABC-type multidrug transport system ATPase subunit
LSLFQLLKELAAGGLTVVAVVHQPRAEVFAATDDLIVLGAGGCLFYSGPSVSQHDKSLFRMRYTLASAVGGY